MFRYVSERHQHFFRKLVKISGVSFERGAFRSCRAALEDFLTRRGPSRTAADEALREKVGLVGDQKCF